MIVRRGLVGGVRRVIHLTRVVRLNVSIHRWIVNGSELLSIMPLGRIGVLSFLIKGRIMVAFIHLLLL